jgi:curved DNA-binding protein CbpA
VAASPSLYQTLQVDPRAEHAVIQAAYRALIKRYHPDRGGSASQAQRLNAAYATLGNPSTRRAYDALRATAAPADAPSARPREVADGSATGGAGLVARLRPSLGERFLPPDARGPGWLFDFAGRSPEAPHERIFMKGFERGHAADAQAFRLRIEAARLLEPLWRRGPDLFVAVLPRASSDFTSLLRAPRGPLTRLSYAVAVVDLAGRAIHAVGATADLCSLRVLADVMEGRAPRASRAERAPA